MAWDKTKQEEYAASLKDAKDRIELEANSDLASRGSAYANNLANSLMSTAAASGLGSLTSGGYYPGTTTTVTLGSPTWIQEYTDHVPMKKFEQLQAHVIELVDIVESLMNEVNDLKAQVALSRTKKAA